MKKILSLLLSILMLTSIAAGAAITANAAEKENFLYENEIEKYNQETGDYDYYDGALVYYYLGSDTNVVIPDTLGGYSVVCIDILFWDVDLKSIVIPKTVTEIAEGSFEDCDNLTDVYYMGSADDWKDVAVSVKNEALYNAAMHFNYGSGNETLHKHTWSGKTVLKKATTDLNGLVSYTCSSCGAVKYQLTDVLPFAKGTIIREDTFDENTFEDYQIKYKVTGNFKVSVVGTTDKTITEITINPYFYYYNFGAVDYEAYDDYDEYVKAYNSYYNYYTESGMEISLINGGEYKITSIGDSAFKGYTKLKKVTIGSKVTKIGKKAFAKCTSLKSVSGCAGVKTFGAYAFYNDAKLTNVNNSEKTTKIGTKAFANCKSLVRVGTDIGVTALSKLQSIGSYAFYKCSSLTAVNIPSNVTKISTKAFARCTSLKKVTGCSGVENIGSYAFYNDKKLKYVSGCKKVTEIGAKAFAHCSALVRIGSSKGKITLTKVKTIGDYAFYNCAKISKTAITSAALTSIGKAAFKGCRAMTSFSENSKKLTSIGKQAFYGDKSLKSVTLQTAGLKKSNVGADAFKGIKNTCAFKVPSGKGKSYKQIFIAKGASSKIKIKKA